MAHTTVKISQLPTASFSDITSLTDVLPIISGDTTKQITVDNLFGTATHITASGNVSGSGTSTGSFGLLRASNIGGNSPLKISDVTEINFNNADLRGNTIIHSDINVYSGSAFLDAEDNPFFISNDIQGAAGLITFGGVGARTLVQGYGIKLGANATQHVTASGNISASGDITANNLTLSGDATIKGNLTFGDSTSDSVSFGAEVSSSIIPDANNAYALGSSTKRWSSISAHSSSFNYISASHLDLDSASLSIGGTPFTKTDVDNLKSGKSISTNTDKQVVHQNDDSTFVQMKSTAPGRVIHKVSNVNLFDMQTSSFAIGDSANNVPIVLQASSLSITGSTSNTGSLEQSGSSIFTGSLEQSGSSTFTGGGFVINDLLNLLANYGSVGLPTGSGAGNVSAGDINLDGQVNVNDLLLILGGMGNPNIINQNLTIPNNINHQLIGPEITVSQSIVVTVGTDAFLTIN